MEVELRKIAKDNYEEILDLKVAKHQEGYVFISLL